MEGEKENEEETVTNENNLPETPQQPKQIKHNWGSRRRPKGNLAPIEEAKIECLQLQKEVIREENERKRMLFELDLENKKLKIDEEKEQRRLLFQKELEHKQRLYDIIEQNAIINKQNII